MKLELIAVNLTARTLSHIDSSKMKKVEFKKDGFDPAFIRYVEDYCTENGFEIVNAETAGIVRNYHLIKK